MANRLAPRPVHPQVQFGEWRVRELKAWLGARAVPCVAELACAFK